MNDSLEPVPANELLERAREGLVSVLDVRPPEEYAAGHLPGAVNVPLNELENHLDSLDTDREIVAYCRGPHCILAFDAVATSQAWTCCTTPGGWVAGMAIGGDACGHISVA